jgi:hypothetical protein
MPRHPRTRPEVITHILLWCCLLLSGYYFFNRVIFAERFGFHDWYLFIGHAKTFVLSGMLYDRDLVLYGPAAAVYKFPPLYVSLLVFFLRCGLSDATIYHIMGISYFACYFLSIAICLRIAQKQQQHHTMLLPLAVIIAFTFEPFFDNYDSSQMEIYILLLLSLSLLSLLQTRDMLSGFFMGMAVAIKIYPIYFALYYLVNKKYSAMSGMILGLCLASIFSLAITGWAEHLFYFLHILPTLLAEPISSKGENLSLGHLLLAIHVPMQKAEWICLLLLFFPVLSAFKTKQAHIAICFSIFTVTLLLATKNSWWNYQILLILPLFVMLGTLSERNRVSCLIVAMLSVAYLLIFWCNLGKLDTLILFFTKVLDASPLLTTIMLKINLLRGLGSFLILLALVLSLYRQEQKNISLVETGPST